MLLSHIDSVLIFAPILLVYGFLFVKNGWKDIWKDRLFLITLGLFGAFTVAMSLGPYRTLLLAHWGSEITGLAPGLEFEIVGTLQYRTRMLGVTREPARDIIEHDVSVDIFRVTAR